MLSAEVLGLLNDGLIKGQVIDATTNEPLPYATVILKDVNNQYIAGGITDELGYFELDNIAFGTFTLEIQFIGYENFNRI